MKLSEYINGLKNFLDECGDMECYYAVDDEGNSFVKLYHCGTYSYIHKQDKDNYRIESLYSEEDIVDDTEDFIRICVVN